MMVESARDLPIIAGPLFKDVHGRSPSAPAARSDGADQGDKDYAYGLYDQGYYSVIKANERRASHRWRLRWVERCIAPKAGERIGRFGLRRGHGHAISGRPRRDLPRC